ncbi:MAG: hypothetical protein DYG98_24650 [Haliscomenobacteraceae bacterium CHB4]|nr:hypothetical protein [Haliscomenobacteraceae bacterium CHB4]
MGKIFRLVRGRNITSRHIAYHPGSVAGLGYDHRTIAGHCFFHHIGRTFGKGAKREYIHSIEVFHYRIVRDLVPDEQFHVGAVEDFQRCFHERYVFVVVRRVAKEQDVFFIFIETQFFAQAFIVQFELFEPDAVGYYVAYAFSRNCIGHLLGFTDDGR